MNNMFSQSWIQLTNDFDFMMVQMFMVLHIFKYMTIQGYTLQTIWGYRRKILWTEIAERIWIYLSEPVTQLKERRLRECAVRKFPSSRPDLPSTFCQYRQSSYRFALLHCLLYTLHRPLESEIKYEIQPQLKKTMAYYNLRLKCFISKL